MIRMVMALANVPGEGVIVGVFKDENYGVCVLLLLGNGAFETIPVTDIKLREPAI